MKRAPHASMMYSVIELEIAAAPRRAATDQLAAGDSEPFRQFSQEIVDDLRSALTLIEEVLGDLEQRVVAADVEESSR